MVLVSYAVGSQIRVPELEVFSRCLAESWVGRLEGLLPGGKVYILPFSNYCAVIKKASNR